MIELNYITLFALLLAVIIIGIFIGGLSAFSSKESLKEENFFLYEMLQIKQREIDELEKKIEEQNYERNN